MILPRHGAELYCGVVELAAAPLRQCQVLMPLH